MLLYCVFCTSDNKPILNLNLKVSWTKETMFFPQTIFLVSRYIHIYVSIGTGGGGVGFDYVYGQHHIKMSSFAIFILQRLAKNLTNEQ